MRYTKKIGSYHVRKKPAFYPVIEKNHLLILSILQKGFVYFISTIHNQTHTHIHTLTHSLTHTLTNLLRYTLTHSLTHTLTHSLTYSLNHTLTHSPSSLSLKLWSEDRTAK